MMKKALLTLVFALIGLLPCASSAQAEEDLAAAQKFFESYLQAGYNFDKSMLDMFADDAVSHTTILSPDGTPMNTAMDAAEIRKALEHYVNEGAKQGVKMTFENVAYTATSQGVRVTAKTNYHHFCYIDDFYTARLARNDKGEYRIKEEFFRVPAQSQCKKI